MLHKFEDVNDSGVAIFTHATADSDNPYSKTYCMKLRFETDDFRKLSMNHDANYWKDNLVITTVAI